MDNQLNTPTVSASPTDGNLADPQDLNEKSVS
jgi:hypothetical protein